MTEKDPRPVLTYINGNKLLNETIEVFNCSSSLNGCETVTRTEVLREYKTRNDPECKRNQKKRKYHYNAMK